LADVLASHCAKYLQLDQFLAAFVQQEVWTSLLLQTIRLFSWLIHGS